MDTDKRVAPFLLFVYSFGLQNSLATSHILQSIKNIGAAPITYQCPSKVKGIKFV